MDIENDPKIIAWFELKDAPQSTRRTYGVYINLFCETAKKTPSQIIDEAIKEMKAGKLLHEMSLTSYFPLFMKKLKKDMSHLILIQYSHWKSCQKEIIEQE